MVIHLFCLIIGVCIGILIMGYINDKAEEKLDKCQYCGQPIKSYWMFCPKCGYDKKYDEQLFKNIININNIINIINNKTRVLYKFIKYCCQNEFYGNIDAVIDTLLKLGTDKDNPPLIISVARFTYNDDYSKKKVFDYLLLRLYWFTYNDDYSNNYSNQQFRIMDSLIKHGININAQDENGNTALMFLSLSKYIYDINTINSAKLLIKSGADVNLKNNGGMTALMNASAVGSDELVELLINAGARVNEVDNDGRTAIFYACRLRDYTIFDKKCLKLVKFLIDNGADVNLKNNGGMTALMSASDVSHELIELLIKSGARVNEVDDNGKSALMYAIISSSDIEVVKFLIDNGANVNLKSNDSETALMNAYIRGTKELVELLINSGADVNLIDFNLKDNYGRTKLMEASEIGNKEAVELLINAGARVNEIDNDGNTALFYACRLRDYTIFDKKCLKLVKFLIDNGADVNIKNNVGQTPLSVSSGKVEKLLRKSGAN